MFSVKDHDWNLCNAPESDEQADESNYEESYRFLWGEKWIFFFQNCNEIDGKNDCKLKKIRKKN